MDKRYVSILDEIKKKGGSLDGGHFNDKVLIVDECRKTGCHGEGLLTQLESESKKTLNIKLHAADDCFIPLGDAAMLTLPSRESIINNSIILINE